MTEDAIEVVPTIVPDVLDDVRAVSGRYASFTSFFQIDVADGKFASNTTWLPSEGDVLPEEYGYEVHLMVADPRTVGTRFAHGGARRLIPHLEALSGAARAKLLFDEWRAAGVESIGVGMLLQTPLEDIESYLPHLDFVLLMTIASIGVQGIPFDESAPKRIADFRARFPEALIAVDGGVSAANIEALAHAGARRFGVGSAIAKAPDPVVQYERLLSLAKGALV